MIHFETMTSTEISDNMERILSSIAVQKSAKLETCADGNISLLNYTLE